MWEPFFGDGSRTVLDSGLSKVLPVSDAALGAASYLADAVAGVLFGVSRWKTAPWIVVVFALAVGPLGIISILLVIAQPVGVTAVKITRGGVAQAAVTATGLWLMVAPSVLGHAGTTAGKADRLLGPLIVAAGFLAVFPITRLVRWFNLLPAAGLVVAPFLTGAPTSATVNSVVCGIVVLVLAPVERAPQDRYGGGWDTLVKPERLPR